MATATDSKGPMQRWSARSRRVALSRKLLPALIAAIVVTMGGWILYRTLAPGQLLTAKAGAPMVNPRVRGRDANDKPYLIGAIQLMRDEADNKRLILAEPFVTLGDARLSGKTGIYRQDLGSLSLQGGVLFDDGAGTRLTTDQATFDTKKGTLAGEQAVSGGRVVADNSSGHTEADSFAVYDRGAHISLKGHVKGTLKGRL